LRSECGSISWPRMCLARSVRIVNGRELPAGSGMVHGAVVLLNVNDSPRHRQTGMSAAPAARPAPASRPSSRLPNELIDYSILGLLWNGTPYFPRAGVPQDQSAEASRGVRVRAIWRGRPSAQPERESALNLQVRLSTSSDAAGLGIW
jgi:hypothetical protein